MKEVTVRPLFQGEREKLVDWLQRNLQNDVDPDILRYPSLVVWGAYNGKTIGFLPVQTAAVLESFAPNPETGDLERAEALRQLVKQSISTAWSSGIRELYFIGSDDAVIRMAVRHGFEEIQSRVFRLKLVESCK